MNPREIQKLNELLKQLKQLDQVKKLALLLEQLRKAKAIRDEFQRREWAAEHESIFRGLKPEDWAWLQEKADYDPAAWQALVKSLGGEGQPS